MQKWYTVSNYIFSFPYFVTKLRQAEVYRLNLQKKLPVWEIRNSSLAITDVSNFSPRTLSLSEKTWIKQIATIVSSRIILL